mmetsp:Transcript_23367/g.51804  ORF Transcript_23367/g.51804 Transcript_23367/m.51804 type:complete len:130 (+) Transcript_23367:2292-2681(+)
MILINRTYCTKTIRYIVNIVPMDSNGDSFQYRSDFPVTSTLSTDPLGVPKNQTCPEDEFRIFENSDGDSKQSISTTNFDLRRRSILYYLVDSLCKYKMKCFLSRTFKQNFKTKIHEIRYLFTFVTIRYH